MHSIGRLSSGGRGKEAFLLICMDISYNTFLLVDVRIKRMQLILGSKWAEFEKNILKEKFEKVKTDTRKYGKNKTIMKE